MRYEDYGTPYYTTSGAKIPNVIKYLKDDVKMNSVRVRLFVNPTNAKKDGTFQNLDYVTKFGKKVKDAGMQFMLDMHYSDSWADPSNQAVPSSWYKGTLSSTNPSNESLVDSMYSYTKRVLEHLETNGATPDYVQIGNEISYGMLWRTNNDKCFSSSSASVWKRLTNLLSSASKAVREVAPNAKIVLHIERSGDKDTAVKFFNTMKANGVDYDIIGLSYYPFWHKGIQNFSKTLSALETSFSDKEIQIVETAYYNSNFPSNDSSFENTTSTWPATSAGQKQYVEELIKMLNEHSHVTGLYYWCAEENGNGGSKYDVNKLVISSWLNRGLWDNNSHKALPALFSLKQFNGDNVVGISSVTAPKENSSIYSLQGVKMKDANRRGFYIINGKKYIR